MGTKQLVSRATGTTRRLQHALHAVLEDAPVAELNYLLCAVNAPALVEVAGRATLDMLTGHRLGDLTTVARCAHTRARAATGPTRPPAGWLAGMAGARGVRLACVVLPVHPAACRSVCPLGSSGEALALLGSSLLGGRARQAGRASHVSGTAPRRAVLVDALQKVGLRYRPRRPAWAARLLLETRGAALTALKAYVDDGGDYHSTYKLAYHDLQARRGPQHPPCCPGSPCRPSAAPGEAPSANNRGRPTCALAGP